MVDKYLMLALIAINLNYGLAVVTMSPQLAKIVPKNLPPLKEEYIICFNKYWEIKESLDKEMRQQWNCTDGCPKGEECCVSYKVWDRLSHLKLGDECSQSAVSMVRMFLPMALKKIKDKCEPDYEYGSITCTAMEAELPSVAQNSTKPLTNQNPHSFVQFM